MESISYGTLVLTSAFWKALTDSDNGHSVGYTTVRVREKEQKL